MKVLIAEDELTSRRLLEHTLTKWGYEVVSVRDGYQAWDVLQSEDAPKLAILDWMMPGLNGVDVCRKVRALRTGEDQYVFVILLTAKSSKQDVIDGIEAGADDYVVKPFDHQELRVRLQAGERIIRLQSELVKARELFKTQAMYDPLTGAFNRRAIMERLDAELARADREKTQLSVAMLDLDHFKNVNDTYGHQAGDEVLRETVRRIQSSLRQYDCVGRYGGEEFLIVVPGLGENGEHVVFERILQTVSERNMDMPGGDARVTASLGVATWDDSSDTADELISAADSALYEAKRNGRNRVVHASGVKELPLME